MWSSAGGCDPESGSDRNANGRFGGAAALGTRPLQGCVQLGADRRAASAGAADAGGVDSHCTDYEDESETVRSGETCVVVGIDKNA